MNRTHGFMDGCGEGRQQRGSRGDASDEGDVRAIRTRGLALWVTRSDSELNAQSTLTVEGNTGEGAVK